MVRVLHLRNYGVYVADERGERHHSPHAHVKERGRRIASLHLVTLAPLNQIAPIPNDVMNLIRENQDVLLERWEDLNP
jgi:hypothetical protein